MIERIYILDINCINCNAKIHRTFKNVKAIKHFDIKEDFVDIDFDEKTISLDEICVILKEAGFTASKNVFENKTLSDRLNDYKKHPKKYSKLKKSLFYMISIFFILSILEAITYIGLRNYVPNLFAKYFVWFIYLNLSVVAISTAIWFIKSYSTQVSCMVGMMIGMTLGMQTGMMVGVVVGATNGFFTGAMVAMISAVIIGAILGSCCGIMGILEGMMAGVMGGTMGAMIPLMMLSDNLYLFMPFYMLINLFIILGLMYMFYEQAIEGKKDVLEKKVDFISLLSISIVITFIIGVLMIYGPKSVLFR